MKKANLDTILTQVKEFFKKAAEKVSERIGKRPGPKKKPGRGEKAAPAPQKLSRKELLEILVKQSRRIEELEAQLQEANGKLAERTLTIENAGSLAEAALKLNHVFEAADAACRQYQESLKQMAEQRDTAQRGEEDAP